MLAIQRTLEAEGQDEPGVRWGDFLPHLRSDLHETLPHRANSNSPTMPAN